MTRALIIITAWNFVQIMFQAFYPPTITSTYIATGVLIVLTLISAIIDLTWNAPKKENEPDTSDK